MKADDIAVGIEDPQGKLVGLEFQTAGGQPLYYDHNGFYHSSENGDGRGKRFDIYHLKLPKDAKLVCWLLTSKSLISVPFKLTHLALPKKS